MRWPVAAIVMCGCWASHGEAPPPAAPPPEVAHAAGSADVAWLAGTWRDGDFVEHWQPVAGALYGVGLSDSSFVVSIIDGAPLSLFAIPEAGEPITLRATSATSRHSEWRDAAGHAITLTRSPTTWRTEYTAPGREPDARTFSPAELEPAPELAAAERQFAADTAAHGAAGWTSWFAGDGVQWEDDQRITGDAIAAHITATLAHGTLAWTPVAAWKHRFIGFTLGEWTFTAPAGAIHGSYCTVWRQQVDGSWKVEFDIGRPAS